MDRAGQGRLARWSSSAQRTGCSFAPVTLGGKISRVDSLCLPRFLPSRKARRMSASYPALRLRRTRSTGWSRRLHAETVLTPADLIWPLFVVEGDGIEQPIATLPGVSRWSVDQIVARGREARDLG